MRSAGSRAALVTRRRRTPTAHGGTRRRGSLPAYRAEGGRIATRILLDRRGSPVLLVSVVRFTAVATGWEEVVLRSAGQYFFERVGNAWRIVSFDVTRDDRPREAA